MDRLTAATLGLACRIFFAHAYRRSCDISARRMPYVDIPADAPVDEYLPSGQYARGVAEEISPQQGDRPGYAFRLGCDHFAHLKMSALKIDDGGETLWVFGVETHDMFFRPVILDGEPIELDADHEEWLQIRQKNFHLKGLIESEFAAAGLETALSVLRRDLKTPTR